MVDNQKVKFFKFGSSTKKKEQFNEAFKNVIEEDVTLLESRIAKMSKDIAKRVVKINADYKNDKKYKVTEIDEVINDTEELISNLIIQKGNIKTGFFASNKKAKKQKVLDLEELIDYLSKCQNDFISMKVEYNKLKTRKLKGREIDDIEKVIDEEEDPLERTINFYMKKQERNN